MFALAVADTAICMSGVVISLAFNHVLMKMIFQYVLNVAIMFSILLLVFVSIERLIAVRRPHTFNMNPRRAKIHLFMFLLCTSLLIIATGWPSIWNIHMLMLFQKRAF